jgi:hypothetical protein
MKHTTCGFGKRKSNLRRDKRCIQYQVAVTLSLLSLYNVNANIPNTLQLRLPGEGAAWRLHRVHHQFTVGEVGGPDGPRNLVAGAQVPLYRDMEGHVLAVSGDPQLELALDIRLAENWWAKDEEASRVLPNEPGPRGARSSPGELRIASA